MTCKVMTGVKHERNTSFGEIEKSEGGFGPEVLTDCSR